MSSDNQYMDPCEVIGDPDSESDGGSGPPPQPSASEREYDPSEPLYPFNASLIPADPTRHSRKIYILDSSNYYPGRQWRNFRLGLRTPAELDFSIPEQPGEMSFRNIEGGTSRNYITKENSLRERAEQNNLDIPPRDNFRMMLDKVWTMWPPLSGDLSYKTESFRGTILSARSAQRQDIHVQHMPKRYPVGLPDDAEQNVRVYDFRYSDFDTPSSNVRNHPIRLYLWHEEELVTDDDDWILPHYRSGLGVRFFRDFFIQKISQKPSYWRIGTSESPLDSSGEPIPERITHILDSWVFGNPNENDSSVLVNSKQNWLINPGEIYEDYCFYAPASYDISLIRPDDWGNPVNPFSIDSAISIESHVKGSEILSPEDREQIEASLRTGELTIDDILEQPPTTTEADILDFYTLCRLSEGYAQLARSDTVRKFDSANMLKMKQYNAYTDEVASRVPSRVKESLERHVDIKFSNHESRIAKIIQENHISHFLLDIFYQAENRRETFTQIIDYDNLSAPNAAQSPDPSQRRLEADVTENFTTLKKVRDFYFKFEDHAENMHDPDYFTSLIGHYSLGVRSQSWPLYLRAMGNVRNELRDYLRDKRRSYGSILDGGLTHSEVVAYKVEKKISSTGELVQTYLIFNHQPPVQDEGNLGIFRDPEGIRLIDTQLIPGQTYEYSVFTINAVIGLEYQYEEGSVFSDPNGRDPLYESEEVGGPQWGNISIQGYPAWNHLQSNHFPNYYGAHVRATNHLSLVEAPYYQKTITIQNRPPNRPEVIFLPEVGVEDKFTLLFQHSLQASSQQVPIAIQPEDQAKIAEMYRDQNKEPGSSIEYQTTSNPLVYEAMILGVPPDAYSDFSSSKVLKTDFTKPYLQFKVDVNRNYYIIVRAKDQGGISNPSEVYRVRMESHEDGINPVFESYEMGQSIEASEIEFKNIISIEPSQSQRLLFNPDSPQIDSAEFFHSAPDINSLRLETFTSGEATVWQRKFKFRLKSKTSGKSIDINVGFTQDRTERQRVEGSDQISVESGNPQVTQSEYTDLTSDQQYRYGEVDRELNYESNETPPPREPETERDRMPPGETDRSRDDIETSEFLEQGQITGFTEAAAEELEAFGVFTMDAPPPPATVKTPEVKTEATNPKATGVTPSVMGVNVIVNPKDAASSSFSEAKANFESKVGEMKSSSTNLSRKEKGSAVGVVGNVIQKQPGSSQGKPSISPRVNTATQVNEDAPDAANLENFNTGGYRK